MKQLLAVLAVLFLMAVPAFSTSITNTGFEAVQRYTTDFCAKWLVTGCQPSTADIYKPTAWNTFFHEKDLGQSYLIPHSGTYSVALWYQPPGECQWNQSAPTFSCAATTDGFEGSLIQHDVSFDNSSFYIDFWAKKCSFRPVQCNVWNCDGVQYYGSNETNTGQFYFTLTDLNTSASVNYPAISGDDWAKYRVAVSSIDPTHLFDVYLQTYVADLRQTAPDCILFDDFSVNYTAAALPVSPAVAYINDMITKTNFPYAEVTTKGAGWDTATLDVVKVSKGFATVPLLNVSWTVTKDGGFGSSCTNNFDNNGLVYAANMNLTGGTALNVSAMRSTGSHCWTASDHASIWVTVPLPEYAIMQNITVWAGINSGNYVQSVITFTSDLSVRATYSSPLTGYETLTGQPDLWPVLVYNDVVLSNNTHLFRTYDFMGTQDAVSNIVYERRSSTGALLEVSSDTLTIPSGDTAWSSNWMSTPGTGDTVKVKFTTISLSYMSDTQTTFPLSAFSTACSSGCDGTAWRESVLSGGSCNSVYTPLDSRCYTAPSATPVIPGIGGVDYSAPLFTLSDYPFLTVFLTPILWFALLVIGIGGYLAYRSGSPYIGMAGMLVLFIIFTAAGIFPFWIALIIGIGIALMLVNMFTKPFVNPGGGGG